MPPWHTKKKTHNLTPEQEALLLLSWAQKLADRAQLATAAATVKKHNALYTCAYREFRARCEAELLHLGKELRLLLAEKERDEQALQANPENERAQEAYRVAVQELERVRDLITRRNALLSAASPQDLGGFVDLPLEAYPEKFSGTSTSSSSNSEYGMEDVYTILIGLVVASLGVLAMLYLFLWSKEVHFECIATDIPTGRVVLRMYNDASGPVVIVAPFDSEKVSAEGASLYGIELYVREKGNPEFKLSIPPDNAWTYQGSPTRNMESLRISPKLSAELSLSLKALEKDFPKLDGYRIVVKSKRGYEVFRFEQVFVR